MMKKQLKMAITLGLVLSAVTFNEASALNPLFLNGDHTLNGTYYRQGDILEAQAGNTMNVTAAGDLILQTENPSATTAYVTVRANNGSTINIDMQGHDLTAIGSRDVILQCGNRATALPASLNITNAKDIVVELRGSDAGNGILCWDGHMALQGDSLTIKNGGVTGGYSAIYVYRPNSSILLDFQNDVNVLSEGWGIINSDTSQNCYTTINSHKGSINVESGEKYGIYFRHDCTVSLNAEKEINFHNSTTPTLCGYDGANIILHAKEDINIVNDDNYGLRSAMISPSVLGANFEFTSDNGTINIDVGGTGGYAGRLQGVGTANFNSNTKITSTYRGINTFSNYEVNFAKGLEINTGSNHALISQTAGKINSLSFTDPKKITGNLRIADTDSEINLNMGTADSFLTGYTNETGGTITLNMKNKSLWNVTADSNLTNFTADTATVNMRHSGNDVNETLTVGNLSGNGNYIMNTDLQSSFDSKDVTMNGDKIVITTASTGNNILDLRDISLDTGKLAEGYLLLVEDQSNGAATFSGKDLDHGGIFKYKPLIVTDNPTDYTGFNAAAKNWYLTGFEKTLEVSDNTNVTLGMSDTRYANYLMDTDTLLKRLGELRMLKAEEDNNGLWARYRHGGMNGERFDGNFTTFQIGYDKKTSQKRYTGIAFSHTTNDYTLGEGSSEGSMDALSIYNTWLGDKNHYFDIVGKIGRMRGNSTYADSLFPEKGDYESKFYSLSGEYGRKNINEDGYYYEPQVQLTLGKISGDDYTTSRGTKVSQDGITSLLGRVGVTLGKEFDQDNPDKHSNVYAKVNYLHEFKGDSTTILTDTYGDSFGPTTEFGGSWWNLGIGTTINLDKETHLYVDVEKNFGGEVKTNWIAQVGCRWTW